MYSLHTYMYAYSTYVTSSHICIYTQEIRALLRYATYMQILKLTCVTSVHLEGWPAG